MLAHPAVENSSDFMPLDSSNEYPRQSRVVGAQVDRMPSEPEISLSQENENIWQENSEFPSTREGTQDMDAKIDAALEMVDRINTAQGSAETEKDNLDIPAFLRNGMKDLSLS